MAEPDYWSVYLALLPDEVPRIEDAAPDVVPSERFAVIAEERPDEDTSWMLAVRVVAGSWDQAVDEATALYSRIRTAAGLSPAEPTVLGAMTPIFGTPLYQRLLDEASQLRDQGRHELSIVRSQTAAEVYATDAMRHIVGRHLGEANQGKALRLLKRTLGDTRSQLVFEALTGRVVKDEPWWDSYSTHLQRRNAVVHEGLAVTEEDATTSLRAVEAFMQFLQSEWATLGGQRARPLS